MDHDYERDDTIYTDDSSDICSTDDDYDNNDGPSDQQRDLFDMLSFISVISKVEAGATKQWTPYVLLSIHLGPWNSFHPTSPYRGNSFAVTLISREAFLRSTPIGLGNGREEPLFPQLVAVKTPLLEKGDDKKTKNSHLFRSISKEYQILRSESLSYHDNVINAYGCCWQSLDVYDGLPIPCLILDGTELGDLAKFCQTHDLTLRERLGMCIQVTTGLQAVHAVGIIHGDLKPQNILIFHSKPDTYIAKLADFGEAIVLAQNKPPFRRPTGTNLYYAPECYNAAVTFDKNGLLKAEIFSLGIVLSSIIQGMHILEEMEEMKNVDGLESLKKRDGLVGWLSSLSREDQGSALFGDGDKSVNSTNQWETVPNWSLNSPLADKELWAAFLSLLNRTLAPSPIHRFESEEEVLVLLRTMLCLNLKRTLIYRETFETRPVQPQPRSLPWAAPGSAQWSAQLSAQWSRLLSIPMAVSHAKLQKATGDKISMSRALDRQEIEAISLSCLMRHNRPHFNREFRFIEKYMTGKRRKPRLTKRRMRLFRPLHRRSEARVIQEYEEHHRLVSHFTYIALAWAKRQVLLGMQAALKLVERDGASIFKVTSDSNLFWLLPHSVKELLECVLLQEATTVSNDISRQAEAAFEYTNMVLNSGSLSVQRIDTALGLLSKSAQMGHVTARATFGRLHSIFDLPSPVSLEIETEWLLVALRQGSLTAWRRLQAIEPLLTREKTCQIPYSCLHPEADITFEENIMHCIYSPDFTKVRHAVVQHCARTGDTEGFLYFNSHIPGDNNVQNVFGETPLVVACRGGYAEMVALLLQHMGDPRIATKSGVTALHFLSAFDDENIPRIAALLLQHGAEIEKQSEPALMYKSTFDSPYIPVGGTPLQWAVIAGNSCAIQTLLGEGADPFTEETHLTDSSFIGSPIMWAATFHQFHLLKVLLECSAKTRHQHTDIKLRLNAMAQPLLSVAIDSNPGFKFREYLIHGKDIELNALRCVQVLIEYGINPEIFSQNPDGKDSHPILLAAASGNKSVLEFLWGYKNGSLRPALEKWTSALQLTIFEHHYSLFDFLIAHRGDITASPEADVSAAIRCLTLTTDKHFALGCVRLLLQSRAALHPTNLMDVFFAAISTNNFEAAKLLFEQGVDPTARLEFNNTILGFLIESSAAYPNIEEKVSFLLSLQEKPDPLFWNVTYLDRNALTALQAIVSTKNGKMMNLRVFDIILKKFDKECYLNAKIKGLARDQYKCWTALHLATYYSNFEAVLKLSEMPGINLSSRSSHGETPADICITRELQFAKTSVTEIYGGSDPEERNKNLRILRRLLSEGGSLSRYSDITRVFAKKSNNAIDDVLEAVEYLNLEVIKEASVQADLVTMTLRGDATGALRKGGYLPPGW